MAVLLALASLAQVALAALLLAGALHLLRSGAAAWRWPLPSREPARRPDETLPRVTVQLPLRNERAVAERVIRAAVALDWPADRLEVQVLDDSDDDTREIVDRVVAELTAAGAAMPLQYPPAPAPAPGSFRPTAPAKPSASASTSAGRATPPAPGPAIRVLRRADRAGFKAGNLAHGLPSAGGEFLLVLDADSVPAPDLIRRLIDPLLDDPRLGFTQARWSHDNEEASLLTRVQALILDGLMLVEQPLLSRRGLPLSFNGTAGMWRRAALAAAGGWLPPSGADASVTEDLDLSYRARLAGFGGRALPEVAVRSELPATMAAFRAQQRRWVRGGGEALRALGRRLVKSDLALGERLSMIAHLARHARQPLLLAAALWLPASVAGAIALPLSDGVVWPALVVLVLVAVGVYYGAARRRLGRSALGAMVLAPCVVALAMGMSLALSVAMIAGVVRGSRGGEFVRTPKGGGYRARGDWLAVGEIAIGTGALAAAGIAIVHGDVVAGVAVAVLVAAGFLWVGVASLVAR